MRCTFQRDGGFMACVNEGCGRRVRIVDHGLPAERYVANCRADPEYKKPQRSEETPKPIYLGTRIKQGLDSLGITQERVAVLVEAIGLPPSCGGCAKRQENLDEFDRKVRDWLSQAAEWFKSIATSPAPPPPPAESQ